MSSINEKELERFIIWSLDEDIKEGDHTALACIPPTTRGQAKLLVKEKGILAGVDLAKRIFHHVDPTIEFVTYIKDGTPVEVGDIAFKVEGLSRDILTTERLVLNMMQRMSGIASLSRIYADIARPYNVTILDTRKTTPLIRFLEKWAVRIGGCTNYRYGLYDRIMIKDNHIDFCGSLQKAIQRVHNYLQENNLSLEITVEVRDHKEVVQAMEVGGFQRMMLDNFSPEDIIRAVSMVQGKFELEASGGITLETLEAYCKTGIDFISVGALTHSSKSMDLSLKKSDL